MHELNQHDTLSSSKSNTKVVIRSLSHGSERLVAHVGLRSDLLHTVRWLSIPACWCGIFKRLSGVRDWSGDVSLELGRLRSKHIFDEAWHCDLLVPDVYVALPKFVDFKFIPLLLQSTNDLVRGDRLPFLGHDGEQRADLA